MLACAKRNHGLSDRVTVAPAVITDRAAVNSERMGFFSALSKGLVVSILLTNSEVDKERFGIHGPSVLGKKKVVSFDTTFKNNPMNISKNEIFFRNRSKNFCF
jgi:hypothetical protein